LRPRGYLVSFGSASGPIKNFSLELLKKNSLFITAPSLFHYIDNIKGMGDELFGHMAAGVITIPTPTKMTLSDAARAHALLENRQTTGATIFLP
jgi:NADPH2:quinone reductase